MIYRRFLLALIILLSVACTISGQSTVKDMRSRVNRLQQQIKENERILLSSEKDVASKLRNLDLLRAQVEERKSLIELLSKEVSAIDGEIKSLLAEVSREEARIGKSKNEYASALKRARRYGTLQDKLLFIVSADNFNSLLHRYRYTREYMNAHRRLADKLKDDIAALEAKRAEVEKVREGKVEALEEQKREQDKLKKLEERQNALVAELKRENKKVQNELKRQRKEVDKLNASIDREIERQIAARRKAEEQAAKKKIEAEPKRGTKRNDAVAQKDKKTVAPPKVDRREEPVVDVDSKEMKKLSGTFAQNKGRLPSPITGPYMLVGRFGPQKGVTGKGNVRIDFGGITLQGKKGAKARAVFKGVVSGVVVDGDYAFVLLRHGSYITIYCRLANIRVAEGDRLDAGDIIADVATDASGVTSLLFQVRNERVKLDPRPWLNL